MNLNNFYERTIHTLRQNSPAILTGLGVSGVLATAYLSHRAGMKTAEVMQEHFLQNVGLELSEQERKDVVKRVFNETWRNYIPPVSLAVVTIACTVGSQTLNSRRQAALMAGISVVERTLTEYREKNAQLNGQKADEQVRQAVVEDRIKGNPDPEGGMMILTGEQIRAYDMMSDRYFVTTVNQLAKAENEINFQCIHHMYASVNQFWSKVGLSTLPMGEEMGWNTDSKLELVYHYRADEEGRPVVAIEFRRPPTSTYSNLW